jgi:hypothetical protein
MIMEQQNGPEITAEELRNVAQFVEDTVLDTVADYSTIRFPPTEGDLKDFPRASPQDQLARQGFTNLRESAEQAISMLYALAAALDNDLPVPPALLVSVQPYVVTFRDAAREWQKELHRTAGEESKQSAEDNAPPGSGN